MSSFNDYDRTAAHYDVTRSAVAVDVITGCLAQGPRPVAQATVVDAGCGTGNYTLALAPEVARVEAVDLSAGMLQRAKAKISAAGLSHKVRFHHASIDDLPLADGAVDAVTVNQVLHHLADDPDAGYPAHRRAVAEFARVLAPGGSLVLNTSSQEQLTHGVWFFHLIPIGSSRLRERYVPIATMIAILTDAGFDVGEPIVPRDVIVLGDDYLDGRGLLRESWRHGDSVWSLVPDDELAAAERTIRSLDQRGELDRYVADRDRRRDELGQLTFLHAIRRA